MQMNVFLSRINILTLAGWQWWHTPLIPALGRQRQVDICEFKASLVYRVNSRTGSNATEKLEKQNKQTNKQTKTKKDAFSISQR